VYFQDGQTTFWPDKPGHKTWGVAQSLNDMRSAIADGREKGVFREVIVVAVHPLERSFEYTPVKWDNDEPGGGSTEYTRYFCRLKDEFIDRYYRTLPSPSTTAVVGSSFGGLVSVLIGLTSPDRFGYIGAMSPSLWLAWRKENSPKVLSKFDSVLQSPELRPKIFVSHGLRESSIAASCSDWISFLISCYGFQMGRDLAHFADPIGGHREDAWTYHFRLFYLQFFAHPDFPSLQS